MPHNVDPPILNPYAFPQTRDVNIGDEGMTLRDYFAAHAASGLASLGQSSVSIQFIHPNEVAKVAFEIADEMIQARQRATKGKT